MRTMMTVAVVVLLSGLAGLIATDPSIAAAPPRSFTCSGSAGEIFTQRTVTGLLTADAKPYSVTVTGPGGVVLDAHAGKGTNLGPSDQHPGYVKWDLTAPTANGDLFLMSMPAVLPGAGGFFDADLDQEFAGGLNGGLQISMFDCTVTGGRPALSRPPGLRTFSCAGSAGEAFTRHTVTGQLSSANRPQQITVSDASGTIVSYRAGRARLVGQSTLHSGYTAWDVTGATAGGDDYFLNIAPVLPAAGGYFDADLDIEFAGGLNGGLQISMFDCLVGAAA